MRVDGQGDGHGRECTSCQRQRNAGLQGHVNNFFDSEQDVGSTCLSNKPIAVRYASFYLYISSCKPLSNGNTPHTRLLGAGAVRQQARGGVDPRARAVARPMVRHLLRQTPAAMTMRSIRTTTWSRARRTRCRRSRRGGSGLDLFPLPVCRFYTGIWISAIPIASSLRVHWPLRMMWQVCSSYPTQPLSRTCFKYPLYNATPFKQSIMTCSPASSSSVRHHA